MTNYRGTKFILTEDISPHKITLLVIIYFYCVAEIEDKILSAILPVIALILENEVIFDRNERPVILMGLNDLYYSLEKSIVKSACLDSKGIRLGEAQLDIHNIQQKILQTLWSIQSPEDLVREVKKCSEVLVTSDTVTMDEQKAPNGIKRPVMSKSLLGTFIRKTIATYNLLNFEEEIMLYEAFVAYRDASGDSLVADNLESLKVASRRETKASSHDAWNSSDSISNDATANSNNQKSKEEDALFFDHLNEVLNEELNIKISVDSPTSSKTIEKDRIVAIPRTYLQKLLDKQIELLEKYGSKTPKALKDMMYLMTSPNSNMTSVQHTGINNIPSYYYVKYLEALHDLDYHNAFLALHQYFDYMVSNNSKYFYHFALISLASLHQYFGEDQKALDAIQEAVSVARENKDNNTLTFILSWLYNFMKTKPHAWRTQNFYHSNSEEHLLDFLMKKSHSVSPLLYAMSHHFETLHIMNSGGSLNKYLESLLKGNYISLSDGKASFVRSCELSATVWGRIGTLSLSDLYNGIALETAKSSGNIEQELSLKIREAYLIFYKGNVDLAYSKFNQLNSAAMQDKFLYKNLGLRIKIMIVKINITKGRHRAAEKMMENLLSSDIQDIELEFETKYLAAEVQAALKNYTRALKYISDASSLAQTSFPQTQVNLFDVMKMKLLKCRIFINSGANERVFSLLLQHINEAKSIGFLTIVLEGLVLFSAALINMKYYEDSNKVLCAIMPQVLSLQNMELTSTALYEFSRGCCYSILDSNKSLRTKEVLSIFLSTLNASIGGFKLSSNLCMLKECFSLEKLMAEHQNNTELLDHATTSLHKLRNRMNKESSFGLIS